MVTAIDPITVEVIGNHFESVTAEMGITLVKSSYSTNIKERRDCSAVLLDAQGRTISLTAYTGGHLGSVLGLMDEVFKRYPLESIKPGDVFMANDPYSGGPTHLPDITVVAPYFRGDELVAFCATVGHHTEVGGGLGAASDIWGEGIRFPPIKIFDQGELREDVLQLILLNVRKPDERRGDLEAQFAGVRIGQRRLEELFGHYTKEQILGSAAILFDQTERRIRRSIAALPDGRYEFQDCMDDDGFEAEMIPIRCAITIRGDEIELDFTGTGPQVKGGINVTFSALRATVYFTLKSALAPDVPPNAGLYRPIKIVAPTGCLVNCVEPAAVLNRSDAYSRVIDVIVGALAPAAPDKVIAACKGATTGVGFHGWAGEGNRYWSYLETIGGGFGARLGLDGVDGVQTGTSNTSNLPSEAMEMEYPLFVERYELIPDSGGPGMYRGGQGILRRYRVLADGTYVRTKGDRCKTQPWGLFGGKAGFAGRFILNPGTPEERELGSKEFNIPMKKGGVVEVWTPGSGGYGDVSKRDPDRVLRDVLAGKVTREAARRDYGVAVDEARIEQLAHDL